MAAIGSPGRFAAGADNGLPGTPAQAQSEIGSLAELVEADAGLDDLPPAHFPSYVGHDAPTAQAHFPAAGGDQLEATTTLPSEGASIPDLLRQLLDGQAACPSGGQAACTAAGAACSDTQL